MDHRMRVFLAFVVLLMMPQIAVAQGPITILREPTITIGLRPGISETVAVSRIFKTIHIANPDIVEAAAETDRRITFIAKVPGETTVRILDANSELIGNVHVVVAAIEKAKELLRESYAGVPGRVRIYNHPRQLAGFTVYACGTRCELVEEIRSKVLPPVITTTTYDPRTGTNTTTTTPE
jgi:hypothetical protein